MILETKYKDPKFRLPITDNSIFDLKKI